MSGLEIGTVACSVWYTGVAHTRPWRHPLLRRSFLTRSAWTRDPWCTARLPSVHAPRGAPALLKALQRGPGSGPLRIFKGSPAPELLQPGMWRCMALGRDVAWSSSLSPYEVLGVDKNATTEDIKAGYRRMAKTFHPDVYSGSPPLEEGETAEGRFIQIQAAYELLTDPAQKQQYDLDNRTNPMKASKAWREWVMRKRKAFEQRGDLAFSAWADQQQRELSLRARQLSKAKTDPEEERRLLARERAATMEVFETTLKRHTLVLKKRDIEQKRRQEAARKRLVADLLLAEGLELEDE